MKEFKNDFFATLRFAYRNILLFFRDRFTVFLAILTPLIVLMLYIFFLGDIQVDTVKSALPAGLEIDEKLIHAFVDSWLIAGIMCVSCLTVAFNSMLVMVADKEKNIYRDFTAAPVKPSVLTLGYFLSFYAVTFVICFGALLVGMAYLALRGEFYITVGDFFTTVGILLLSVMNSVLILMFILGFFKSSSASGAFSGIFSAVIGFLTGAYLPVSFFPKGIAYFTVAIPGSASGGLFRNALMRGALAEMTKGFPPVFEESMRNSFSLQQEFFSHTLGTDFMWIYLAVTTVVFLVANIAVGIFRKKRGGMSLKSLTKAGKRDYNLNS